MSVIRLPQINSKAKATCIILHAMKPESINAFRNKKVTSTGKISGRIWVGVGNANIGKHMAREKNEKSRHYESFVFS